MKVQNEKNRFGSWFYLKQSWGKSKIVATHIFQANEALQIHTTELKKKTTECFSKFWKQK